MAPTAAPTRQPRSSSAYWMCDEPQPISPPSAPPSRMAAKASARRPRGERDGPRAGDRCRAGPGHNVESYAAARQCAPSSSCPTYNEAENIERRVPTCAQGASPTPRSWWSTTPAPTAPPTSPTRSAAELGGVARPAPARRRAVSAPPTVEGFAGGLGRGSTSWSRWTPTCPTTRRRCRPCSGRRRARRRPGHRFPLRPRRLIPDWSWQRTLLSRGGATATPPVVLGLRGQRRHRRATAPTGPTLLAELDRSTRPGRRLRLPDRDDLPRSCARRRPVSSRSRSPSSTACEGTSKMSGRIVVEALALVTWWARPRRSPSLGRRRA